MKFVNTSIPDILLIEPHVFKDERGFFMETFRADEFRSAGIRVDFVQDNHSRSKFHSLRGLHYQIKNSQAKLVRVIAGEIFDVAVDLRRDSETFGKWVGTVLSAQNKIQMWIPEGFAHGFYVLSDYAEVLYKASDYYAPQWERTLLWNDPQVSIDWPLQRGTDPIVSDKDALGSSLNKADLFG
jgi:dTDP-4-dehydrorhamnose 3,5-epimerase